MRIIRLAALSTALVGLLTGAVAAVAHAEDPTLTLSHDTVSPGYGFFVRGTGCAAGTVTAVVDGYGTTRTPDAAGNWELFWSVPPEGGAPITITATCRSTEASFDYGAVTVDVGGTDLGIGPVMIPAASGGPDASPGPGKTAQPAKTSKPSRSSKPSLPSTGW